MKLPDRFRKMIDKKDKNGCQHWLGYKLKGFGKYTCNKIKKTFYAHILVYENVYGKIEDTSVIIHTCDNKDCCNHEHLKLITITDRFWSHVNKSIDIDKCWTWNDSKFKDGYGKFSVKHKCVYAHRYIYEIHAKEKIPEGLFVLHKCNNPPCVNPNHLFLGTHQDNMNQMVEEGRSCHKLTKSDRNEIKELYNTTKITFNELSKDFNVSLGAISDIIRFWNENKWNKNKNKNKE